MRTNCLIDLPVINEEQKKKDGKLTKIFGTAVIVTIVAALITGILSGFLFTKECVSREIRLHLQGYLWSQGYNVNPVQAFRVYYQKEKGTLNDKDIKKYNKAKEKNRSLTLEKYYIGERCKVADIKESDVYLNKAEASSLVGFDYFNHIQKCYINTKNDPYYNVATKRRNRNYIRDGWRYAVLYC